MRLAQAEPYHPASVAVAEAWKDRAREALYLGQSQRIQSVLNELGELQAGVLGDQLRLALGRARLHEENPREAVRVLRKCGLSEARKLELEAFRRLGAELLPIIQESFTSLVPLEIDRCFFLCEAAEVTYGIFRLDPDLLENVVSMREALYLSLSRAVEEMLCRVDSAGHFNEAAYLAFQDGNGGLAHYLLRIALSLDPQHSVATRSLRALQGKGILERGSEPDAVDILVRREMADWVNPSQRARLWEQVRPA